MSEPYLPLYVGDYLKDTGFLTVEQHGAYCLLLMRMWSAGGELPNDEAKLARLLGLSVKKWRPIWAALLGYFIVSDSVLTHKRVTEELEKAEILRQKRAAAGAKGGSKKANGNKAPTEAIATAGPKQIIPEQVDKGASQAQHPSAAGHSRADLDLIENQLREASGQQQDPTPTLMVLSAPLGWIQSGHDWQLDVLPTVRVVASRMTRKPKSWDYYTEPIREASAKRRGMSLAPAEAPAAGKTNIFDNMAQRARNGTGASGGSTGTTIDAVPSVPLRIGQAEPDDGEGVFARH